MNKIPLVLERKWHEYHNQISYAMKQTKCFTEYLIINTILSVELYSTIVVVYSIMIIYYLKIQIILLITHLQKIYIMFVLFYDRKLEKFQFCILIRVTSKSVKTNGHQLITILQSLAVLSILEKKMLVDVEYLPLVISSKSISYIPTSVSA